MVMFPRRWLRKAVNSLLKNAPEQNITNLAERLDNPISVLPAEWETAWAYAFSKCGKMEFEPLYKIDDGAAEKVPDILFHSTDSKAPELLLDVTSITNKGNDDLDPLDRFVKDFHELCFKHSYPLGGYKFTFGRRYKTIGKQKYYVTAIPDAQNIQRVIQTDIRLFLESAQNTDGFSAHIVSYDSDFKITYDKKEKFTSYNGNEVIRRPQNTSLWGQLRAKRSQLKPIVTSALKGVIVCNSGYVPVGIDDRISAHSNRKIIEAFIRSQSTICFVAYVWVERHHDQLEDRDLIGGRDKLFFEVVCSDYVQPNDRDYIVRCFLSASSFFPNHIEITSRGAAFRLSQLQRFGLVSIPFTNTPFSARKEKVLKVKVSARNLLELVAGRTDHDTFLKKCGLDHTNPLRRAVEDNLQVRNIKFIRCHDRDDDWLEFEFGDEDPAVGSIRATLPDRRAI